MGASKNEYFSKHHNKMADLAKALSHPARIAILEYLMSVDKCICGDIVNGITSSATYCFPTFKSIKKCWIYQREHRKQRHRLLH